MPGAGGVDRGARPSRARRPTATPCCGSAARTRSRRRCSSRCLQLVARLHAGRSDGDVRLRAVRVSKDSPLKTVQRRDRRGQEESGQVQHRLDRGRQRRRTCRRLRFARWRGLNVPTVPFRTTGEVVTALISGNVQAAFETMPGVIGQINAARCGRSRCRRTGACRCCRTCRPSAKAACRTTGSIRGTASWCRPRRRATSCSGVNKELNGAIATPEIQKRFRELIMEPRTGTPEDLQKIYDDRRRDLAPGHHRRNIQPN